MSSSFAESWNRFTDLLQKFNKDLVIELEYCYRDIEKIIKLQISQELPNLSQETPSLEQFLDIYQETKQNFFINIIAEWEKKRPYKRALIAVESYEKKIQELINSLPNSLTTTNNEVLLVISIVSTKTWKHKIAALSKKEKTLAFKGCVAEKLEGIYPAQASLLGRYFQALAKLIEKLKDCWDNTYHTLSNTILQKTVFTKNLTDIKFITAKLVRECQQAISKFNKLYENLTKQITDNILTSLIFGSKKYKSNNSKYKEQCSANLFYWSKLIESVETDLRLEQKIQSSELKTFYYLQAILNNTLQERTSVLNELDQAIHWLKEQKEFNNKFPLPSANIIPTASRLQEFETTLQNHLQILPVTCEVITKFSSLPPRKLKLNQLYPQNKFHDSFLRRGKEKLFAILTNIESQHRKITQYVEQAREVVSFNLQIAQIENSFEVIQEALQNALSLLEFCRQEATDWYSQVNKEMLQTVVEFYAEGRILLSQDRIGILTYLAQQNIKHLLPIVKEKALLNSKKFIQSLKIYTKYVFENWLISIGWMREPVTGESTVKIRAFLPKEFSIDTQNLSLPALYKHLFRFEAVEDPRFLVGREKDIRVLEEAKKMWEKANAVSIVIVGERGSGKTSLINCAVKQIFKGDIEIIQDEFQGRIIKEEELQLFLSQLIKVNNINLLEQSLLENRRIIILEETERLFLRQVGHYGALKALQRLITITAKTTLWILCINKTAFDLLNVTINLGQTFSHQINMGVASKKVMKSAIMLRHNLSGLRLKINKPPKQGNFLERLSRKYLNSENSEAIFFNSLEEESGGIFRAAFKIWLGHIDSIQAGLLTMKAIIKPDRSALIEDLDLENLFTLVAILQHGSLTYEEHSIIFQSNVAKSKLQIHALIDRQIVELEPNRAGYRVSADAMPVVKELLYRRNLI